MTYACQLQFVEGQQAETLTNSEILDINCLAFILGFTRI